MTEEQIKALCKWAIHNSQRPLTEIQLPVGKLHALSVTSKTLSNLFDVVSSGEKK